MNEDSLIQFLKATSFAGAGLFAGAAISCSLVDVPARKSQGTTASITHFQAGFKRIAIQQTVAGVLSGVSGICVGKLLLESDPKHAKLFLAGGAIIFSVLPYTALFMKPTLDYLLDSKVDKTSQKTADELDKWAKLHFVRTVAGCLAVLVFSKAVFY